MLATGGGFGLGVLEVYSGLLNPCRTLWCAKLGIQKPRFAVERTEGSLVKGQLCKKQESHAMQAVSEQLHLASHRPMRASSVCPVHLSATMAPLLPEAVADALLQAYIMQASDSQGNPIPLN